MSSSAIELDHDISLISAKEASEISGKSIITIKRAVSKKLLWSKKVRGLNGFEIRVKKEDVLKYFNLHQPISKSQNDIYHGIPQAISNSTNDKENPYLKVILDQLEKRSNENEKLLEKIDKLHTLLENQQKLTHQLQNQVTSLTENQNLMLTQKFKDGQNGFVVVEENTEEIPKRKKFLGIF